MRGRGGARQRSPMDGNACYVEANPPHLLSGALHCGKCGSSIGQVSGKGSGYYGCLAAVRGACGNKLLVSRRVTENAVLTAVRERLSDPAPIHYVLERIQAEVRRLQAHLPGEIELKRAGLVSAQRRIANCVDFIGEGKGTRALGEALIAAELKAASLRAELQAYEASEEMLFNAPLMKWLVERMSALKSVLETDATGSGLMLRRVLGPIRLVPVVPQLGRPYYQAETALQTLELIDTPEDGSNRLRWWRRSPIFGIRSWASAWSKRWPPCTSNSVRGARRTSRS